MNDLVVTAGYLGTLAGQQDQAAEQIGAATTVTTDAKTSVWVSHGVASVSFNIAVVKAEAARRALGEHMKASATDLGAKLRIADDVYDDTDMQLAENLDKILRG
jgi:hypothetical protein